MFTMFTMFMMFMMFMSCIFVTCREGVILPTASKRDLARQEQSSGWALVQEKGESPRSKHSVYDPESGDPRATAHWTIDYRASIGLYWYFNSNVSATHTHNYIATSHLCTTTQSHIWIYLHICSILHTLYIYICAQSILCAYLKLFVCMSCSTLYNIIISCFVDHVVHSFIHWFIIILY